MQQAAPCTRCGQPVPAGAAFCPTCGASAQSAPMQLASNVPTQMAATPPISAGDNAPTQLAPPPPPPVGAAPPYAGPAVQDAPGVYGSGPSQPAYAPPPPPPGYAPGPPPVMTPGGVAPWAQPPKKSGRRLALGCVVGVVLLVLLLGGGGFLAFRLLASGKGSNAAGQHAGNTPGATSGATSTPGSSGAAQTLDNINRQAVYAGVMVTVASASEARQMPDFQNFQPDQDAILKIATTIDYESSRHGGFYFTGRVMGPDSKLIVRGLGHGLPKDILPEILGDPIKLSGAFYFEVPKAVNISDWTLVIGEDSEVLVQIPLAGSYDPTAYQEHEHTMGLNQPIKFDNGNITGVITRIVTVTWNFCGCEAPKEKRFLRVYFHVSNNTSAPVFVGDGTYPQYLLIFPNGDRLQADTQYNAPINVTVAGKESKDVGFDSWVIPTDPTPFTMVFLNPDGSQAGQIDLGTV